MGSDIAPSAGVENPDGQPDSFLVMLPIASRYRKNTLNARVTDIKVACQEKSEQIQKAWRFFISRAILIEERNALQHLFSPGQRENPLIS